MCGAAGTLSTRIGTPPLHAPTPTWPEDEAATPSQGFDNDDSLCPVTYSVFNIIDFYPNILGKKCAFW